MAYTIHKSDGTPVTVADNNADLNYYSGALPPAVGTGTILIGRNYINYGAPIAQNFLQLTENFASTILPNDSAALQGQLWFEKNSATNSTDGNLYVRVSSATTGGSANWRKIVTTNTTGGLTFDGDITVSPGFTFNGSGAPIAGHGTGITNLPNSALDNSTVTIGTTNIALGGTSTTLAGLTSVTSTNFVGGGTGLTDIQNSALQYAWVDLGGQNGGTATRLTLGTTIGTVDGLTITHGNFSGSGAGLTDIPISAITGGSAGSGVAVINPTTPKDGDIRVTGAVIDIYAQGAWRQVFPAVYS